MAAAPPNTFVHAFAPASRSSRNSSQPQNNSTRLFVFHSGKAIEIPTFLIANTVSVFATAHNMPAKIAHVIKCGFSRRSSKM